MINKPATNENMTDREKIIKNYIDGYNRFDIDKMTIDFDDDIIFENIVNGEVNLSLQGLEAFIRQAEQAKAYFSERTQTITSFRHSSDSTEITIGYHAILAMDLPNGIKKGEELNLTGRSVFQFDRNKIIKLQDIS